MACWASTDQGVAPAEGSRKKRIAKGSGTTPGDINQVLNQFYNIQKMTKMMAKGKLPGNMSNLLGR